MMDYKTKVEMLSKEESKYCCANLHLEECRNRIFEAYIPYVIKMANGIHKGNKLVDIEDLINEGMMALWKAILTFNPDKGYTIFALIKTCVRNNILDYTYKQNKANNHTSLDIVTTEEGEATMYDLIEDESYNIDEITDVNAIVEIFDKVLSERDKNIMMDFYLKEIKQKDLVEKYGLSGQGHVGLIIKRSKKKLQKVMV